YSGVLQATYVAPPAPAVTALSPASGPEAGGTAVTITGTNFTGTSAVTFGAAAAPSFTVNSATSITATSPAGTGTVNVRVTTGGGTSATAAANQFTYAAAALAPSVTANPANAVVIAGNTASFTASASGTPAPTVQWQVSTDSGASFSNISGAISTTLSFTAVAGDNNKQFRAVFANSAGTATTTAATLSVQTPPVITTQPVGATVAPGQGIPVSVAASGNPAPTYNWLYSQDGGASFTSLSTSASFTLVAPTPRVLLLKVIVSNAAGSVTSDTVTLTWAKQGQTISFTSTAPTSAVVGGATYAVSATATSGLAVSYSVDPSASSICSVTGSTVSFIGVGTCVINANQAGNSSFDPAPQVQQAFAVGQGSNVITFPPLSDTPFASPPPALSATASSGLAVSYASNSTGICTVSGGAISFVAGGTCSITASQDGNATYQAATPVTQTFAVTAGVNTITFPALPDTPFTSAPPVLSATASSGLAVSYASNSAAICTASGNTISFVAAGTCSITASQAGNANYAAATPVTNTFAVTPGVNTITFAPLANRALGSGAFTLSATASSGLAVTYSTSTGSICSVSGNTVSLLDIGTCTILADQGGNANFAPAPQVSQSFEVTRSVTTVTLTSSTSVVFFGMPVTLTATVTGQSPTGTVTFSDGASVIGTAPVSGGTAALTISSLPTGSRQLTASYQGDTRNLPATSAAVAVAVNTRPNPAADPNVQGTIDGQVRTNEMFARTQMDNISDRLNSLHGDDPDQDAVRITFSQPRPRLRSDLPWADEARSTQAVGIGDAALLPGSATAVASPYGEAAAAGASTGNSATVVPAAARTVRIWASGNVSFGKQLASGAVENRFTSSGITVGMDSKATDNLKLGVAIGFAWDNTRVGASGGESDAINASLAFYGSFKAAPQTYIDVIVGTGYGSSHNTRLSTAGQVMLEGKRRHSQLFGAVIVTVEARAGKLRLSPYLKADVIGVRLSPYSETGSPFWALS
ncbi:MAG: autotransporter domain-containing protein, partial [Sphingomonadaceae bacterium]|nr:autotransporter domain-containing protein [Sphingomonadaceae bacterium]